ncbi:MAG TPA: 50S ribosomal protein L25/general stress protein Ctc [Devosia sp.]|nr:50S ribosomal protein L25/general stress protein Ctc [Devosia sp.]
MSTTLEASARNRVGKGAARELRRNKQIPGVIYGDNKDPLPIALSTKDVTKAIHAGGFLSHTMHVVVDGTKHHVIPRDYQMDPVRDFIVHVDFLRIGARTKLTIEVPVHFTNEELSPGLKRGGVLNIVRHTVEVTCLASNIPEAFELDLTDTEVGESLNISMVTLPDGVTPTITDRDFTIATIAAPSALRSGGDEEEDADAEGEEGAEEADAESGDDD